ncbi:ankyrin [Daldinia sp. FL1419]|nr:ankyrin [Daldinia sp. FL1419]
MDLATVTKSRAKLQAGPEESLICTNTGNPNELTGMPVEIILNIARYMSQKTKTRLKRTCRDFSVIMDTALYDQDAHEDRHALWWACATNHYGLLRRIIAYDAGLVNHQFQIAHSVKLTSSASSRRLRTYSHDMGTKYSKDLSPLAVAIRYGNFNAFTILLARGAKVDVAVPSRSMGNGKLWFPIHWVLRCCKSGGDFDDCAALLVKHGANINQAPLLEGVPNTFEDGVPLLEMIDFKPDYRVTRLEPHPVKIYEACLESRFSNVKTLLKLGADPNFKASNTFQTAIFKTAKELATYDPNAPFGRQIAPYYNIGLVYDEVAVPHGLRLFEAFIKNGGDPNVPCLGTTALHVLCKRSREHELLIDYLIRMGASIDALDDQGRTPIYEYVMFPRSWKLLEAFIKRGANVNHQDIKGRTPLHAACADYRTCNVYLQDTIKVLLRYGADATLRDSEGKTALGLYDLRGFPGLEENRLILLQAEMEGHGIGVRVGNYGDGGPSGSQRARRGNNNYR